jgi:hypothetical protein
MPGISTSAPIVTARSGAPGATRPTSSAPACDRSRSSMPRSPRTGSHSMPASTRWAGDVHPWIRYVQAMKPSSAPRAGHKASPPMAPIVRDAWPVRPAFVPRTTGRRQEAMSAAEQQDAQVIGRIGASLQVPEVTPKTLSRWRHGFKSRWDYRGKRVTEPPREPKVVTVQVTLCASSEIVRHTQVASVHVVRRGNRLVGTRFPLKSRIYPGRRSPSEKSSRTM